MVDTDRDPDSHPCEAFPSRRDYDERAFDSLDTGAVLDDLETLDVHEWRTTSEANAVERLAPASEDVAETFDWWDDADRIPASDATGVALVAIQELTARVETQRERIERQERHIEAQRETIAEQREDLESLRSTVESIVAGLVTLRSTVVDERDR